MNSCKYTWIVIRIPLTTCKMKSISTIIAMSLNIIFDTEVYEVLDKNVSLLFGVNSFTIYKIVTIFNNAFVFN